MCIRDSHIDNDDWLCASFDFALLLIITSTFYFFKVHTQHCSLHHCTNNFCDYWHHRCQNDCIQWDMVYHMKLDLSWFTCTLSNLYGLFRQFILLTKVISMPPMSTLAAHCQLKWGTHRLNWWCGLTVHVLLDQWLLFACTPACVPFLLLYCLVLDCGYKYHLNDGMTPNHIPGHSK